MKPYLMRSDEVIKELGAEPENGLNEEAVRASEEKYGRNEFTRTKPRSFVKRVMDACHEPMLILLLVAGVIAVVVNIVRAATGGEADIIECVGIFFAIALSVIITVVMEGKSAKAFEALSRMKDDIQVRVIRSGRVSMIPQSGLVVGDIVCVETGDKLSADGRLIKSTALKVDESSLTGESAPVSKDAEILIVSEKTAVADRGNMLYSGTFVTGGSGTMVVTDVGDTTEFGKIASELSGAEVGSTPLQEKLAKLGKIIAIAGLLISAAVFIIQVVFALIQGNATFLHISEAFITSIVLIVATVPEGLPTIVAVSLALNIIKMSKQNALVKKMVASETIGCINVICSDKTGTLTENRMTVTALYSGTSPLPVDEIGDGHIAQNFAVNSTATVEMADGRPDFIGNPTECALLMALV
ncbi:MAG: HAD-IC family P-type ATPase, partial [Clostridia bacterium]